MTPDTRRLDWIYRALLWFQCSPLAVLIPPNLRRPATLGLLAYYHVLRLSADPEVSAPVRANAQRILAALDCVAAADPCVQAAPPLPFPAVFPLPPPEIPDADPH